MKLTKTASGKQKIHLSKKEWEDIGRTANWDTSNVDQRVLLTITKALAGTGLAKDKAFQFLENVFTGLGDMPISKVISLIKSMPDENQMPAEQAEQAEQAQQVAPQQGATPVV